MAKRAKKSGSKSKKHGRRKSTTWTRFVKAHPGHSMKTLSKMYRERGLYKGKKKSSRKRAKGGKKGTHRRRRHHRSEGGGYRGFGASYRKQLIRDFMDAGMSLPSARKAASEQINKEVGSSVDTSAATANFKEKFEKTKAERQAKAAAAREVAEAREDAKEAKKFYDRIQREQAAERRKEEQTQRREKEMLREAVAAENQFRRAQAAYDKARARYAK